VASTISIPAQGTADPEVIALATQAKADVETLESGMPTVDFASVSSALAAANAALDINGQNLTEMGERPDMRIALCGYEGEHDMPATWECVAWRAKGGYANAGDGSNLNRHRERVWFSPACLRPGVDTGQIDLFAGRST
jgi:hypothetical protein